MGKKTSVNNEFKNDLSVNTSTSARDISLTIKHTDNSNAASHAKVNLITGGASGGDPKTVLSTVSAYASIGVDNDRSDIFKICNTSTIGTTTCLNTQDGLITRQRQPAFGAYRSSTIYNVTGTTTYYGPVIYNTEEFDVSGDYNNSTGYFTCPVDGRYFFAASIYLSGCSTCQALSIRLEGAGTHAQYSRPSSAYDISSNTSTVAELDEGDTVYVRIYAAGEASDICDIPSSSYGNWFQGVLLQ